MNCLFYFILALNLMSQFNLENVTVFSTKSEEVKPKSVCIIAWKKIRIGKSYFNAFFHHGVFTFYSMIFLMMSWRLKRGKWKISQGEGNTNIEKEYNMPLLICLDYLEWSFYGSIIWQFLWKWLQVNSSWLQLVQEVLGASGLL